MRGPDQIASAADPPLSRARRRRQCEEARAYAYGGSLIQDLGYYPFGSHFFSNLVHYVRSGDFVAALIRDAQTVDEYAFALGALAHYASDNAAHPTVNHALPMIYPKLRAKYGDDVLFGDSPARHVMVEFSFDVLQVARGQFKSDAYQNLIGFEVARPLLERAFHETYGLELKDVFGDVGLAIGTYRRAASQIIPDVTRVAWREKRDEILAATPDVTEQRLRLHDDAPAVRGHLRNGLPQARFPRATGRGDLQSHPEVRPVQAAGLRTADGGHRAHVPRQL